jgi:serine/threonine-protein kinase
VTNLTGKTLGQYEIHEEIGHGGMATVYRATQTSIGRMVAVKVLPTHFLQDRTFLERFAREVKIIAQLQHRSILPVYDFGEQDGTPYVVMAYMEGGTLSDRIKRGPLPLDEVVWLVEQIAEGLDHAHNEGVIHRDFKPSNVLLDKVGNAHLADFGIAKVSAATVELTRSGVVVGTPAYMAPEMYRKGDLTNTVDVYALGVTLYQMLTGRLPFQAETPAQFMMSHVNDPVPEVRALRPDLPAGVAGVIEQAMAKTAEARYQSASEMVQALTIAAQGEVIAAALPPEPTPPVEIAAPIPATPPPTPEMLDAPTTDVPSEPAVSARPARRGVNSLLLGGGVAGFGILGTAVVLGVLALAGVFGRPASPPAEDATAGELLAAEVEPEEEPAAAPTEEPTPTGALPPTEAPTDYDGPVTANDQWTPVIQTIDGVEMALVPVGCFMMGSVDGEPDEQPVHEQCFEEAFWVDVTEVTNAQYGSSGQYSGNSRPRESVAWLEAVAHCEARGARLPTEVEWEYAARGPDYLDFPWGNSFSNQSLNFCDTNCPFDLRDSTSNDGNETTSSVGAYPEGESWVGALDMSGNVWEWTSSIYAPYPYNAADGREVDGNSYNSSDRVLRGGSFASYEPSQLRASRRYEFNPRIEYLYFGFRCVRDY